MKLITHISMLSLVIGLICSICLSLSSSLRSEGTDQKLMLFLQTDAYIPTSKTPNRKQLASGVGKLLKEERINYNKILIFNIIAILGLCGVTLISPQQKSDQSNKNA